MLEAKADFAAKLKENEARIAELQKQLAAKTEAPKPEVFDLDDGWGDDLDFGDASGAEAASVPVKVAEGIGADEALTRRRPSLRNT